MNLNPGGPISSDGLLPGCHLPPAQSLKLKSVFLLSSFLKSFKNFRERRCEHYYFYFLLFLCNKTTHFSRRNSAKYIFKKVNSDRIFCYEQINKIGMCLFTKWVSLWFNKDLGGKVLTLELGIEMFEYQVQPFPKKNFTGLCYVK